MRKLVLIFILNLFYFSQPVLAQKDSAKVSFRLPAVIEKNGDTVAVYTLDDTKVDPVVYLDTTGWWRLNRSLSFLVRYARSCANAMREIDTKMAQIDRKIDQKKYLRDQRKLLVKHFGDTLKLLSNFQGEMLIKLINRETGRTAYDLIREYESGFTAGFWQGASRLDGMNLKDIYDPKKDVLLAFAIKMNGY
jgi:hypothetical protein